MTFSESSLESLCSLIVDCPHSTPVWTDSGKIVLRNKNIKVGRLDLSTPSFTDERHFEERIRRGKPIAGDIVITREAPMGDVCMIPKGIECCLGQRQVLLRPDPNIVNAHYLLFSLQSAYVQHQIAWNEGAGSTVSNLRIPNLKALRVPLPERPIQDAIASILVALDDRITLLRETNVTLEAIAQALFKSWFIDFDPVRAKAEGREPEGMDSETALLFPNAFEDSEAGQLPKGWAARPIGEVVKVVGGGTPSTKEPTFWEPAAHYWATPKDMSGLAAPVLLETERQLSSEGLNKVSSGLLPIETVLMSSRAPIGYLAIAKIPTAINQGFIALLPHEEISPGFLLMWCQHNMETINQKANGSTFLEISKATFRSIPMILPTKNVSKAFKKMVSPIYERIAENERQAKVLTLIRDTLLPRLMSGKLRLPDVERELETVG